MVFPSRSNQAIALPGIVPPSVLTISDEEEDMIEMDYVSSLFDDIKDGVVRWWKPWSINTQVQDWIDIGIIIQRVADSRCNEALRHGYTEWNHAPFHLEQFLRTYLRDTIFQVLGTDMSTMELSDHEDMTVECLCAFVDAARECWESGLAKAGLLG